MLVARSIELLVDVMRGGSDVAKRRAAYVLSYLVDVDMCLRLEG